jgi:hypothetical protein
MNFSQPLNYSNMDIINKIKNNSFTQNDINNVNQIQPENNFQQNQNINNTEIDTPPENNADMQQLQITVKDWLNLDDEIRTLQAAIRNRKKQKKEIGVSIINFMDQNKVPHFNLSDGKLIFSQSKHKQPINAKYIVDTLQNHPEFNQNPQKITSLLTFLQNSRKKVVTNRLKRTKLKKK